MAERWPDDETIEISWDNHMHQWRACRVPQNAAGYGYGKTKEEAVQTLYEYEAEEDEYEASLSGDVQE